MTNLTDDDIRAALRHVACRAPDAAAVRSHLADLGRRHRQRRALLATAGVAGVAVVVGAPAAALLHRHLPLFGPGSDVPTLPDVRTPPNLPTPRPEPSPGTGNLWVPLRYPPSYLLDGYVEVSREVSLGSGGAIRQTREWQPSSSLAQKPSKTGPGPGSIRLIVAPEAELPIGDWRLPITVNGAPAGLSPMSGQLPQVVWSVRDGLNMAVQVTGVGDDSRVAQWVARSVQPDGVVGVEVPLRLGYLPLAAAGEQRVSLAADGPDWVAGVGVYRDRTQVGGVYLGPSVAAFAQDGVPTELRGRPGQLALFPSGIGGWGYVELDQGLKLSVYLGVGPPLPTASISADELIQTVNGVTVGSPPYTGWIGQR